MTDFGVTSSGFVTKRLADILAEIDADLRATFGAGIKLAPSSALGQLRGVFAEREAKVWELAEAVYYSAYPDTASGVPLDNAVALTGITRKGETYSKVTGAVLTGTPGTPIPQDSVVQVAGSTSALFSTDTDVTIGGGGTVTVNLTAQSPGPVAAPAGSLTVIKTPVSGWDSVTNPADAAIGQAVETDPALKLRRASSAQKAGASTVPAIQADLLAVDGVTAALIFENLTFGVDANGRPPKSFEAVVQGGLDQDVANVLWADKPAGIQTYGQETVTVTDSQGETHDVSFSRPTAVPIYVVVNLQITADFPAGGDDTVKQQILAYGASLTLGSDVIVTPAMISYLAGIPGIIGATIYVGRAPAPNSSANVTIATFELATFDAARITVTP